MSNPNHPRQTGDGKLRIEDVVDDWDLGFYDGNAIKCILRAKFGNQEIQDIEKALEYLRRYLRVCKEAYERADEEQTATWRPGCGNYISSGTESDD